MDLFAVHPRSFVIFDSDRVSADAGLSKPYAVRFATTALAGRVWVTAGREMENYLDDRVRAWAATDRSDGSVVPSALDRDFAVFHEQVAQVRDAVGRERAAHDTSDEAKVRFAREAVQMMRDAAGVDWLGRLDLRDRLDELLAFVRVG